ncbi:aminotransferase class I/II-fold pyridoxal phosphate-dependent enzyme [Meiothermus sp. QL-1]|uniref:aminotransferase class I/II-fold pyridoxal phosphate-dependent enzyme n=1 Tax=Meiothermus sp. QL-1 TaxID=2058095 RepID=UPI000E0A0681|nr:aminotransferase class I/II-fold pyridoxal phosphate-dependent enzyme [Meiothermus sp. QL-1]RDI95350.1 aminotransferase class I/II-fold pyridoxal phosphate-dependent enzyme [Meiothermus sp. QL-1]
MFRSRRTPPGGGVFLEMDAAKAEARARGLEVVDLSIGASDLPPPPEALQALREALDDPTTYGYCLRSGTQPLLEAATAWYAERYGVRLDPRREALVLIGSQEGLAHLLMAVADPGDGLLMCEVAYPSYFGAARVAGLAAHLMPLGQDLLPRLEAVPEAVARRAKVLLLNYPNNPTAALAPTEFFAEALAFCRRYDLLLIHDNPYLDQALTPTPSPLALPGGRERVVELFSFSKSYHLAGFRLGFALGNAEAIASLEALKAPIDFNPYLGIQRMGIAALRIPPERLRADAELWARRRQVMVEALAEQGWAVPLPAAGMYLWAKLPPGIPSDDLAFTKALVGHTGVALAPGQAFGPGGVGHVRFALVQPEAVLRQSAARIGAFLRSGSFSPTP